METPPKITILKIKARLLANPEYVRKMVSVQSPGLPNSQTFSSWLCLGRPMLKREFLGGYTLSGRPTFTKYMTN